MEATTSYREWLGWIAFQELYDLPDGFMTTGRLGATVGALVGGKSAPVDYVPYLEPPPAARSNASMRAAFDFVRRHAPGKVRKLGERVPVAGAPAPPRSRRGPRRAGRDRVGHAAAVPLEAGGTGGVDPRPEAGGGA